jgi:hypothetical protein
MRRRETMKRLGYLAFIVLFASMLASCAPSNSTPTATGMINPGDKIGDFLITTGGLEGVKSVWDLGCDESEGKASCRLPVGTKVNVSWGIYADASKGEDLETKWAGFTYEMVIDGRPVNLKAFGYVIFPYRYTTRCWDVVITTDKPGEIEIKGTGAPAGETTESEVYTLIFTVP